jgi:hypothetical protein
MHDRKRRLLWTIVAILLPGPWTPVIVLLYVLRRAEERAWDTDNGYPAPYPPSGPDSVAVDPADHRIR